jgi:VanZ family protein
MTSRGTDADVPVSRSTVPSARRAIRVRWLLVLAAAMFVQVLAVYSPGAPHGPEISGLDKLVHLLLFAAPTFAGLAAGLRPRWLLALLAIHAPLSEVVQWAGLPNRDGDVWDALADLTGVLVAWLLFSGWRASRRW